MRARKHGIPTAIPMIDCVFSFDPVLPGSADAADGEPVADPVVCPDLKLTTETTGMLCLDEGASVTVDTEVEVSTDVDLTVEVSRGVDTFVGPAALTIVLPPVDPDTVPGPPAMASHSSREYAIGVLESAQFDAKEL